VPISRHPVEDDSAALARASVADPRPGVHLSVRATVERAARCRVLVAGSYHAALFALAQGVPAVSVAASPYYLDKFLGLQAQFGRWCRVVRVDRPGGLEAAVEATAALWDAAAAARAELLEAARRQSTQAERAYDRLFALAGRPVAAPVCPAPRSASS
jgi:polysaccharide pyruvyl transferase WcaK-like protein